MTDFKIGFIMGALATAVVVFIINRVIIMLA